MTDADRLLHLLLHDLRTPVGVAQGYLRMLQEGRVTGAEDRERMIAKSLQALGQAARLCQSASDFLDISTGQPRLADIAVSDLTQQVELTARDRAVHVNTGRVHASARLALAGDVSLLSEAVILVLSTAGGRRETIHVEADERELRFLAVDTMPSDRPRVTPFDGWSQGLPVAVACRRIAWSAGQILKFETGNGLIAAFPLIEAPPTQETRERGANA